MIGVVQPLSATFLFGVLLAGLFLPGCQKEVGKSTLPAVKVIELAPEQVRSATRFSASVQPRQTVELAFKVSGTVDSLLQVQTPDGKTRDVQEGDAVSKGVVIARLEEQDYQRAYDLAEAQLDKAAASVKRAEANLALAQNDYKWVQDLLARKATTTKEVNDSTNRLKMAEAEVVVAKSELSAVQVALQQRKDQLNYCRLMVPIEHATVSAKTIEPKELVRADQVVFTLVDLNQVHVTFGLPDVLLYGPNRVVPGQQLDVVIETLEGRKFKGTVTKIAPAADKETRTFLTEVTLETPSDEKTGQGIIRPGMIAGILVGHDAEALLIPMIAVQRGQGKEDLVVYKLLEEPNQPPRVVRRKVKLGGVYNNRVELLPESEVKPGDKIVITGVTKLSDGLTVRVLKEEPEKLLH